MNTSDYKRKKSGFTLIELLVVISIIGVLSLIGIPQYQRFAARNQVRTAVNELLQNARLARTLAIKENRTYVIAFNLAGPNTYSIGFDTNNDGVPEGYENTPNVRVVNLRTQYGNDVVYGTTAVNGPDTAQPGICPACADITGSTVSFGATAGPVRAVFNPDGSIDATGSAYITHASRGYTYMFWAGNRSGKFDLWSWDGDMDNLDPPDITQCANPPVRYCEWTEIR